MSDPVRTSIGARRNPETETAVLDAAAALIAEVGFAKLTMEAVARRARAGKATLYRWWPNRALLLLAVYTRCKANLPQPDTGNLADDLQAYLGAMLAQWRGDHGGEPLGPILRLLIAEAQLDPSVQAAMQQERRERWHHIDRITERAAARGELNPALTPAAASRKIIALPWYLLLTDALPPPDETPALVTEIMAGL